jgi:hypothetical protein
MSKIFFFKEKKISKNKNKLRIAVESEGKDIVSSKT